VGTLKFEKNAKSVTYGAEKALPSCGNRLEKGLKAA
jgi:hypothetical protein